MTSQGGISIDAVLWYRDTGGEYESENTVHTAKGTDILSKHNSGI